MTIQSTTDYGQFKTVPGNRQIHEVHYKNLAKSILTKNMLSVNPIIVNKDMQVIDGQHRLKIAQENKLPVYYTIIEQGDITDIQRFNVNVRTWALQDFIDSYAKLGNTEYVVLSDFAKEYKVPATVAAVLLSGDERFPSTLGVKSTTSGIRHGLFKVRYLAQATEVIELVATLRKYMERANIANSLPFIRAIRNLYLHDKTLPNKLIHKLETSGMQLKREMTVKEYMRQFEDILNYRSHEQNLIRLY